MGAGNCSADGGQGAATRTSARFAGDGVSAACLAGIAADSPRPDAHVLAGGAVSWSTESGSSGRACLRNEPGFDRRAVPSRDSRRRSAGRLSMGPFAQGTIADEGTRGYRIGNHQRWRAWRENPGDGENYPRGFTRVTPFGQSCLNLTSPSGRFFIAFM